MKQILTFLCLLAAFFTAPYVIPAQRITIPADLLAASDLIEPQPDYRFTSDGCSGGLSLFWRILFRESPSFEHCCVTHDFAYWRGGTSDERERADAVLWRCVTLIGRPTWAWIMWAGVRPGGHPGLPFPWRWGYGNHYRPFYAEN
jgi:hypothetical protein